MLGALLLGFPNSDNDTKLKDEDFHGWKSLPTHRDEDQVRLDVERSFIYYPNGTSLLSVVTYHNCADSFAQTSPRKSLINGEKSSQTL